MDSNCLCRVQGLFVIQSLIYVQGVDDRLSVGFCISVPGIQRGRGTDSVISQGRLSVGQWVVAIFAEVSGSTFRTLLVSKVRLHGDSSCGVKWAFPITAAPPGRSGAVDMLDRDHPRVSKSHA